MPQAPEDWLKIANDFQERWNFPNTLGAIDGKHISLQAPPHPGSVFYNYKHFFSIVLMALVDADYQFIYVDVGCNGRISDGGVFAGSNLKGALDRRLANIPGKSPLKGDDTQEMSYHMLGDEAFPLREDLMKPFPFRNMSEEQRIFNYRLSRARRVVENAFGIMAAKFRIFLGRIILAPEKAESLVLATCALHNFLRSTRDAAYIGPGTLDDEDEGHHLIHGSWRATDSSLLGLGIDSDFYYR
ncbi:hypothetical protein SNE40_009621 [Patella caerulea]|uniref:DDE Tnp4 domain-containing protein n=1 Tax=Patella caerulea TaxID=87958 RepID=A0AAN8JTT6_PATCE